ncbi:MAG: Kielin/chordin-like protein [Microgenomates group bacterium GW2011_GWA2_40_6]|nr:MAG: Kielin/chordin-like protein [Microgenomates group bacterium GW2011_GWA2_40_6]
MVDSSDNDELQKQYQALLDQYAQALNQSPPISPPPPSTLPAFEPTILPPEIVPPPVSTPSSPLFFKILFYFSLLTFLAVAVAIVYSFSKSQPSTAIPSPTPVPTETQSVTVCELNEKTYQVGESFPAADGCNTCVCQPDQLIICTEIACEATPSTKLTPTKTISPVSTLKQIGYIKKLFTKNIQTYLTVDYVQWISPCPSTEVCLNGYKVINDNAQFQDIPVSSNVKIDVSTKSYALDGNFNFNEAISLQEFTNLVTNPPGNYPTKDILFWFTFDKNKNVVSISEQYRP